MTVLLFYYIITTMTDAYQTLGVTKNATDDEIKKAYRKLASKHHPDKGGDTKKFQEVQTAYDQIETAEKRQSLERGGFEFHFSNGGTGNIDPNDILRSFFEQRGPGAHRQQQPRRNKDLRVSIHVSLSDVLKDTKKTINVTTTNGEKFQVDVTVPRGANNGTTIKYTGQGDNMFESLTRGDLYVIIVVLGDSKLDIQGRTVFTRLEVNSFEAMLGTEKAVSGIDGEYLLKIPAGCQPGTKFALQGKGLFQMNHPVRGDLIVVVNVKTPTLTESQTKLIKSIATNFKT